MQNYISTIKLKFCKNCKVWYKLTDNHLNTNSHIKAVLGYEPITLIESAAKCRLQTFWLQNGKSIKDFKQFFTYCRPFILDKIKDALLQNKSIKCNLIIKSFYLKVGLTSEKKEVSFKTKNEALFLASNLESYYKSVCENLLSEESDYQGRGSGWTLLNIIGLELRINKFQPLSGCEHISLPLEIANKKSIVNVKNNDIFCFKYAIWSKNIKNGNPQRISKYINNIEMENAYNWDCIQYPVSLKDIPKFESVNNISINVFGLEKNIKSNDFTLFPIKIVKIEKNDHRDLLLLKDEKTSHYAWIKNFEKLLSKQISNHNGKKYICKSCLIHFNTKSAFSTHKALCNLYEPVTVQMPTVEDKILSFKKFKHKQWVPYIIYADFECILEKQNTCTDCGLTSCNIHNTCIHKRGKVKCDKLISDRHEHEHSFSVTYQKHIPMSFCYYVVSIFGERSVPYLYRGKDAADVFVKQIRQEALKIKDVYSCKKPILPLTDQEIEEFQSCTTCYICENCFQNNDDKVKDHDSITGKFRGAAHSKCNLLFQLPHFVPVVLHNLSNYDLHIICKSLSYDDLEIRIIPNSEEKYITLSKKVAHKFEVRFIDSFRFMGFSLDKLAKDLCKEQFKETALHFGNDKLETVTCKGVFPYEYIDSWSKLNETSLPSIDKFFSSLTKSNISDVEYNHALKVWDMFSVKSMGEYSDIYLKTDVLLLSDIFQNFRSLCMKHYDLDPAWYFTAPGLSFDACLKMTKIQLELLTDYEQYLMIENGIRGGISQCPTRFCEANNKYVCDENSDIVDPNYIMYFDINNLYGYALVQNLPYKDFQWLSKEEVDSFDVQTILKTKKTDDIGYILEVDLIYPHSLHKKHNNLPFCSERKIPPRGKCVKLLTTLEDKRKYVVHIQNLKQALKNGLILKKVHRIISFKQAPWIEKYINKNTELRAKASNDFEKEFFKLMNNSFFGKTMENIRKRLNMELVCSDKRLQKLISKPNFIDRTIFSTDLVAVHLGKTSLKFNKPIYIGLSVLELSKKLMYSYFYKYFANLFGSEDIDLLYMDTDSFILNIRCNDVYDVMKNQLTYFDTSNYPNSHPCFSIERKKKLGFMKDEFASVPLKRFLGLRSKLYTVESMDRCIKRAKGVKKNVVKQEITFEDYERALFQNKDTYKKMNLIKSKKHELYSIGINKLSLSSHDDKRFVLNDNINTLAHGHVFLLEDKKRKYDIHEELKTNKKIKLG